MLFRADPNMSTDELLQEIKNSAQQGMTLGGPNYLMNTFAALLIRLSHDADATAEKISVFKRI